eukprot:gb/GEZN01004402.1/.p1 GENE.gb/GEZN01004402.1/~~gb/GEZN01004402.1/.p1  ORF type:complete len:643 (-),score=55.22 gb/GEZN01004402.1/:9-1937(-)
MPLTGNSIQVRARIAVSQRSDIMAGPGYGWDDHETYVALLVFLAMWLLIATRWESMPVGRTAGSLVGAVFMVLFGVITNEEADKAVELDTLFLLIGLMLILAVLQEHGVVEFFSQLLTRGVRDPMVILARVSLLSGVSAALIMNDGAALFLGVVVKDICREFDLPLTPYMIAMATSANIGSASTVLGNPKNMVIHSRAHLAFFPFFKSMAPAAAVGLILNTIFLHFYFRSTLRDNKLLRKSFTTDQSTDSDEDIEESEAHDTAAINQQISFLSRNQPADHDKQKQKGTGSSADEETPLLDKLAFPVEHKALSPRDGAGGDQAKRRNHPYLAISPDESEIMALGVKPLDLYALYVNSSQDLDGMYHASVNSISPNLSQGLDTLDKVWGQRADLDGSARSASRSDLDMSATSLPPFSRRSSFDDARGLKKAGLSRKRGRIWKWFQSRAQELLVASVIFGMYVLFLLEFNLGWTCLAAAITIILLERKNPASLWEEVNFELLLYLIALFVTIAGMNTTPAPYVFWNLLSPLMSFGVPLFVSVSAFCLLVLILTLVFTSIPTVLLISPHLHSLPKPLSEFSWLLLAWSVTLCGNLTMLSSVAGVVASETAASVEPISFMTWFRYSFPSTLVILAVGAGVIATSQDV